MHMLMLCNAMQKCEVTPRCYRKFDPIHLEYFYWY